jgi:hypothetical protein
MKALQKALDEKHPRERDKIKQFIGVLDDSMQQLSAQVFMTQFLPKFL